MEIQRGLSFAFPTMTSRQLGLFSTSLTVKAIIACGP
jgi:hypothetical protein